MAGGLNSSNCLLAEEYTVDDFLLELEQSEYSSLLSRLSSVQESQAHLLGPVSNSDCVKLFKQE